VSANRYVTMVIYQKLLPRTKKRGVFYLSLKISSLNRLASYDEYPPAGQHKHTTDPCYRTTPTQHKDNTSTTLGQHQHNTRTTPGQYQHSTNPVLTGHICPLQCCMIFLTFKCTYSKLYYYFKFK